MLSWTKRDEVLTSPITLTDGRSGTAVIVGPRNHPKGASLIVADESGQASNVPLRNTPDLVGVQDMIDILGMQEQTFRSAASGPEPGSA